MPRMPYVEAVLEETMRLYLLVGFLARKALRPDRHYGCDLRPNDTVFPNIYALHRHRLYWRRPEVFDPDRFLLEHKTGRDR